jgi:hypothetical protein
VEESESWIGRGGALTFDEVLALILVAGAAGTVLLIRLNLYWIALGLFLVMGPLGVLLSRSQHPRRISLSSGSIRIEHGGKIDSYPWETVKTRLLRAARYGGWVVVPQPGRPERPKVWLLGARQAKELDRFLNGAAGR